MLYTAPLVNPFSLLFLKRFSLSTKVWEKNENLISSLRFWGATSTTIQPSTRVTTTIRWDCHITHIFFSLIYARDVMMIKEKKWKFAKIVSWINFYFIRKSFLYKRENIKNSSYFLTVIDFVIVFLSKLLEIFSLSHIKLGKNYLVSKWNWDLDFQQICVYARMPKAS